MMKPLIVANWKMNPATAKEALALAKEINGNAEKINAEVVLCPPFPYLPIIYAKKLKNICLGAQDCFWESPPAGGGAFTGEVSPAMLKNIGCKYVILGHSERKKYLGETYVMINKKLKAVLKARLAPVVCIGEKEPLSETAKGEAESQMAQIFAGISAGEMQSAVLAYEPEWAISTNPGAKPATPEGARLSVEYMREILFRLFGDELAKNAKIMYGGSVASHNIKGFMDKAGIQGALVGSASLNAPGFVQLVKNAIK
ncbi:MAG: triose-phosphate isomerase [Candidatus Wildermuthbacteria bacterium]|nr:triose-phosphate isomerase [Candidatus Wildermuthbacteria bacterium]